MPQKKTQFNMFIPEEWKEKLERLARIKSLEEDKNISAHDILKEQIQILIFSGSYEL